MSICNAVLPYFPFARPSIEEDCIASVSETWRSGGIAHVVEFEQAPCEYLGGRPVRAMTSVTGAIEIARKIAGIGPGNFRKGDPFDLGTRNCYLPDQ